MYITVVWQRSVHPLLFHLDAGGAVGVGHGKRAALVADAADVGDRLILDHRAVRAGDDDVKPVGVVRHLLTNGILIISAQVGPFIFPYLHAVDCDRQTLRPIGYAGLLPGGRSIPFGPAQQAELHIGVGFHALRRVGRPDLLRLDAGFLVNVGDDHPALADARGVVGRFHDGEAGRLIHGHAVGAVGEYLPNAINVFLGQVFPGEQPRIFRVQPFFVRAGKAVRLVVGQIFGGHSAVIRPSAAAILGLALQIERRPTPIRGGVVAPHLQGFHGGALGTVGHGEGSAVVADPIGHLVAVRHGFTDVVGIIGLFIAQAGAHHRQIADGAGGPGVAAGPLDGIEGVAVGILDLREFAHLRARFHVDLPGHLEQGEFDGVHILRGHILVVQGQPLFPHHQLDQVVGDGGRSSVILQVRRLGRAYVSGHMAEVIVIQRRVVRQGIARGRFCFHNEVGFARAAVVVKRPFVGLVVIPVRSGVVHRMVRRVHVVGQDLKLAVFIADVDQQRRGAVSLGGGAVLRRAVAGDMLEHAELRARQLQRHVGPVHLGQGVIVLHVVIHGKQLVGAVIVEYGAAAPGNGRYGIAGNGEFKGSVALDGIVDRGLHLRDPVRAVRKAREVNAGVPVIEGNGKQAVLVGGASRVYGVFIGGRIQFFQLEFRAVQRQIVFGVYLLDLYERTGGIGVIVGDIHFAPILIGNVSERAVVAHSVAGLFSLRRHVGPADGVNGGAGGDAFVAVQGRVGFGHFIPAVRQILHQVAVIIGSVLCAFDEIGIGDIAGEYGFAVRRRFGFRNGIAPGVHHDGLCFRLIVPALDGKRDLPLILVGHVLGAAHDGLADLQPAGGGPVVNLHDIAAVVLVAGVIGMIGKGEAVNGAVESVFAGRAGFLDVVGDALLEGEPVVFFAGLDFHVAVPSGGISDGIAHIVHERAVLLVPFGVHHGIAVFIHHGEGDAGNGMGHITGGILVHPDGVDVEAAFAAAGHLAVAGHFVPIAVHLGDVAVGNPLAGIADDLGVVFDDHLSSVGNGEGAGGAPVIVGNVRAGVGRGGTVQINLDGGIDHRQIIREFILQRQGISAVQGAPVGVHRNAEAGQAGGSVVMGAVRRGRTDGIDMFLAQHFRGVIHGGVVGQRAPMRRIVQMDGASLRRDGILVQQRLGGGVLDHHVVNDLVAGIERAVI